VELGELWIGLALAYQGLDDVENAKKAFDKAANSRQISPQLKHYAKQQY